MSSHEGRSRPESTGHGTGRASFLTSGPPLIAAIAGLITAVTGLIVGLSKAGLIGGGTDGFPDENTLVRDLFEPMVSPVGRVYFDGETMFVTATTPGRPVLRLANLSEPVSDVSVSARVRWISGAPDSGYSLVCRYDSPRNYYLFGVLSGSRYNIARYRDGRPTSLTGGVQESSAIDAETNEVSARCVGDNPTRLTLLVNGREVASVEDPEGIESGIVGIRVGSIEARVTYAFEDFVLRSL